MYAVKKDGGFTIPAVDAKRMKPEHIRQVVNYRTSEKPGTIVVDQTARYLYFVFAGRQGYPLRGRRRACCARISRRQGRDRLEGQVAALDADAEHDRAHGPGQASAIGKPKATIK